MAKDEATRSTLADSQSPELAAPAPATAAIRGDFPTVDPGAYEMGPDVSEGGLGRVISARDVRLNRLVAIKQLRFRGGSFDARFRREAQITARLQHPSIVPIYEAGCWPSGEPFYVMKLVSGRSLKEVLADARGLDERLALLPQLLAASEAVAYAHAQRIIHRDIKPANIMIGPFGETLVIDWGLAKALDDEELPLEDPAPGDAPDLTHAGAILGTPAYMPPEQAEGAPVDERADVYALGAALYHLLVGRAPYAGRDSSETVDSVKRGPPVPVGQREPGAPTELIAIAQKAMAREARDRYPSARELAEDLRRFLTGQMVSAHRYSSAVRVRRWLKRNRVPAAVAAVALVALSSLATYSFWRILRERDVARRSQAAAEQSRATAEARRNELLLAQARLLVEKKPTEALAYLKSYAAGDHPDWSAVWAVAADAQSRVVARRLFHGLKLAVLSPDGKRLGAVDGERLVVVDVATATARVLVSGGPRPTHLHFGGRWLGARLADGHIVRWDLETGVQQQLGALGEEVVFVRMSRDGRAFAVAGSSGTVYVFDENGARRELRGHTAPARWLEFSPDGRWMASVGDDGTTRLWSVPDGTGRAVLADAQGWSTAFSPDSRRLAIAATDNTVRVLDLAGGAPRKLVGHQDRIGYVVFSPDGETLYSGSADWTVRVWTLATGAVQVLRGYQGIVERVAISPDGRFLATSSGDQTLRVWDLALGESVVLRGHDDYISQLGFSDGGKLLVSSDPSGQVRFWELPPPPSVTTAHARVHDLGATRDGAIWAAAEGELITLGPDGKQRARYARADLKPPLAVAPDGGAAATLGADGAVLLWRSGREQPIVLRGHGNVNVLAFSPDGRTVAAAGDDRVIRFWDGATGAPQRVLEGHSAAVWVLEFSPDGKWLVSAGDEHNLRLWDLAAGSARILPAVDMVYAAAFSADGRQLAWTAGDATVRLLPLAVGDPRTLSGHRAAVRHVALSPDGRYLASGSDDHTARLWNLETGTSESLQHDGAVRLVRFSPDGGALVSAAEDHTIRLWDVAGAAALRVVRSERPVAMVVFSADGRQVAASFDGDPLVRLWPRGATPPRASPQWLDRLSTAALGPNDTVESPLLPH